MWRDFWEAQHEQRPGSEPVGVQGEISWRALGISTAFGEAGQSGSRASPCVWRREWGIAQDRRCLGLLTQFMHQVEVVSGGHHMPPAVKVPRGRE